MSTPTPDRLIREARQGLGLTQSELAERLGTTQSAIARLESERANPRVATLARVLAACDRRLTIDAAPRSSDVDETLVASQLRLSPAERLRRFEQSYAAARRLALAGRRARGELA